MTTASQRNPQVFGPEITAERVFVQDTLGSTTPGTHRGVTVNNITGGAGHNDYIFRGNGVDGCVVHSQSVSGAVDMTAFPTVKRSVGINQSLVATFTNGRGISNPIDLVFADITEPNYRTGPVANVVASYAEYSFQRITALFNGLTGPAMFDTAGNRAQTSAIPHVAFTGHVFSGGWGDAMGRRFSAITPRHVVGVSHYGYQVGDVVKFKAVDNTIISRTITAVWAGWDYLVSGFTDISMFLLNADLPASIAPFPIVGDWILKIQPGATGSNYTFCPQFYGAILWNNDGHITPCQQAFLADIIISGAASHVIDGITLESIAVDTLREPLDVTLVGSESLSYIVPGNEFYHERRAGDSGSPCLVPVADNKWALSALVSGSLWTAPTLNQAILKVDAIGGVSTGYTVTVAASPI